MDTSNAKADNVRKVGIVAGYGQFPVLFATAAKKRGFSVYAAAHVNETEPVLEECLDGVVWVHLGELGRIFDFFAGHGVRDAVMAGGIHKVRAFGDLRLDEHALRVLATLDHTQDDSVLRAFATALEEQGIAIRPSTWLLPEILAPPGLWTGTPLSDEQAADVAHGFNVARKIGEMDVGQCVVVKKGSVVAVEAIEGTDATIRRGGELAGDGCVVVKVCKPNQDPRFDLPACGLDTVRTLAAAGASVLAVEAGRSIVFDKDSAVSLADELGIALMGVGE
ncbi:MAG: LpxI family protein [Desulfatibacillaceae bacterium]